MADDAPPPDSSGRSPRDSSGRSPRDSSGRSPRDYRPDLRPMLILVGLLVAVVIGWLFISPLILPST